MCKMARRSGKPPCILAILALICSSGAYAKEVLFVPAAAGTISVVDVATNAVDTVLQTNQVDFVGLRAFALSPDRTHAWVIDGFGTLAQLALQTGGLSNRVSIQTPFAVAQLLLLPDESFAYVRTDADVLVVDLRGQQVLKTLSVRPTSPIRLSPDGTRLYVTSTDLGGAGLLNVIETATGATVSSIPWPAAAPVVAPSGTLGLAFRGRDVLALDLQNLTTSAVIPVGASVQDLAFTPDGTLAYAAVRGPAGLSILDVGALTPAAQIPIPDNTISHDFSPWQVVLIGEQAAVLQPDACDIAIVDTATRQAIATIPVDAASFDIAGGTAPDQPQPTPTAATAARAATTPHTCAYVGNPSTQSINVVDPMAQRVTGAIPVDAGGLLAIDVAGTRLYVPIRTNFGASGGIAVIDTATNTIGDVIFVSDAPLSLAPGAGDQTLYAQLNSECYDLAVVDPVQGRLRNRVKHRRLRLCRSAARWEPVVRAAVACRPRCGARWRNGSRRGNNSFSQ